MEEPTEFVNGSKRLIFFFFYYHRPLVNE
jgi:hypothetical protein